MLSGMSSPAVPPRTASPLPLPPQVQTQTKPSRPLKSHAHGTNKRHLQEVSNYSIYSSFFFILWKQEPRPPTPPLTTAHYKKKRSYDVLPTDPSNFLKPATHLVRAYWSFLSLFLMLQISFIPIRLRTATLLCLLVTHHDRNWDLNR